MRWYSTCIPEHPVSPRDTQDPDGFMHLEEEPLASPFEDTGRCNTALHRQVSWPVPPHPLNPCSPPDLPDFQPRLLAGVVPSPPQLQAGMSGNS